MLKIFFAKKIIQRIFFFSFIANHLPLWQALRWLRYVNLFISFFEMWTYYGIILYLNIYETKFPKAVLLSREQIDLAGWIFFFLFFPLCIHPFMKYAVAFVICTIVKETFIFTEIVHITLLSWCICNTWIIHLTFKINSIWH